MLSGVKSLISGIRGCDAEERATWVVATALDVIWWFSSEPPGTPPSLRIYTNTRQRVLRSVVRTRSEPVVFVDDFSRLGADNDLAEGKSGVQQVNEFVV